jgi:F-type H+-transporting ATPase subunit b
VLTLNGTLLIQLVNFIVFLAILNVIFFKPVGAAIAKRRAYIDGLKHDIEQLQSDAKTLRGQADERRIAARRAADEAMARARVDAGAQADTVISVAQTRAAELVAEAQAEVVREVESARREEPRIVNALADELLGRALGGLA